MRRRQFLCMLGAAAACPLAARAQISTDHTAQIAYLGALSPATLDPRQIEQFKAGLLENGLIEAVVDRPLAPWPTAPPNAASNWAGSLVSTMSGSTASELAAHHRLPSIWEGTPSPR